MKKFVSVMGVALLSALAVGSVALAAPRSTESGNQVNCGAPTADAAGLFQVNAAGSTSGGYIEVCNDGGVVPVQGSVYAEGTSSGGGKGTLAADGDASNPEQGRGWARLSSDGKIGCGPDGSTDSRTQGSQANVANCS
jgi:hypothetical protein